MDAETKSLLEDQSKFIDALMGEIINMSNKLARNEPEGWEGSRRRAAYYPAERERLTNRLRGILYVP